MDNNLLVLTELILLLKILQNCECINLKTVEEGPCIVPPVDLQLDFFWMANIPEFYYPIISKFALYKYAAILSGIPIENISEEIAHNSCQMLNINNNIGATISAFRGQKTNIDALITNQGVLDWIQKGSDGNLGYRGRTYTTLTDNNNYIVSVSCFETEKQKSYEITSPSKTLDEASKKVIWEHLKSLGFDVERTWLEPKYDNCYDLSALSSSGSDSGKNETNNISDGDNSPNLTKNSESYLSKIPINSSQNTDTNKSQDDSSSTNDMPLSNGIRSPEQTSHSNISAEHVGNLIYNINNKSALGYTLPVQIQKNIGSFSSLPSDGQKPQNLIIIYNGDPSSTSSPSSKSSENRNSGNLFFDIFKVVIDFLQNAYQNGVKYIFAIVQRILGRFNAFVKPYVT